MNESTKRALDRALKSMARPPRRKPSRFSMAPIVLGLALLLGFQLVHRLVPMVWSTMLPGGWQQANHLRGWPGLVWGLAVASHESFLTSCLWLGGLWVGAMVFSASARPLRPLLWLLAVGAIGADAGIVYVTLTTSIRATAQAAGIDLNEALP